MNNELNGILIVNKEKKMTSHDVVKKIRKNFSVKKVGHAGTLDPNATGVLVLLLGKATKQSQDLTASDKEYIATMKLGEKTDSADCDGKIINIRDVVVTESQIQEVLKSFEGEKEQIPPMVSAKKVNGKKLYALARKGLTVERKPQKINIKEIELLEISFPYVKFRVLCSKGTYIRQLADDVGEKLGCGAHLSDLERTKSGKFSIENALPISDIMDMAPEELQKKLI